MRHDFIDRFSRLNTPVHRAPAWTKTLATVFVVVAVAAAPRSLFAVITSTATALLLIVALVSRIPAMFLVRRLLLVEPFVVGVALLTLMQPDGWRVFAALVARSTVCVFALILYSNTTPFSETIEVLRRTGVPGLLLTVLALMYRYIFVLIDESERLGRARASRSFHRHTERTWRVAAGTAGQLFVRSSERAERIYAAMCARGWKP